MGSETDFIVYEEASVDLNKLLPLLSAAFSADHHQPLGDHAYLDLVEGRREKFTALIAEIPGHPHLIGYSHVTRGRSSWAIDFVVHPHHRSADGEVERRLIEESLKVIEQNGGGHVHIWVPKPREATEKAAKACGLVPGRELYQMRLKITENIPVYEGPLTCRPLQVGKDEEAWLDLNNRAFKNHPEQGAWDLDALKQRFNQEWFDPADMLLFEANGRLVGSIWIKVHHESEPPRGELYVVAVDPGHQGKGLGKIMVSKALRHIAQKSLPEAMLYVDSDNERAVRLYKHFGFEVDHVDRAYVGDVPSR